MRLSQESGELKMETIAVRVKKVEELDNFSRILDENRSKVIRDLIDYGRKMKSLELYKSNKVSLGTAAKLAGINLGEFFDLMEEYKVKINLNLEDAREAMENARKGLKVK